MKTKILIHLKKQTHQISFKRINRKYSKSIMLHRKFKQKKKLKKRRKKKIFRKKENLQKKKMIIL